MRRRNEIVLALCIGSGGAVSAGAQQPTAKLMTLDPGHFHAALIQKEMYPGVDETVHVYGPLGPDLLGHLGRVSAFNRRADRPTRWRLEVHAGPDSLHRMLAEKPGNVVVLSGRNRAKIDAIVAAVEAGLHVLADKPWVIEATDFPKLERALAAADERSLVAYDVMTERYEVTNTLLRELAGADDVIGSIPPGSSDQPALELESVHHLMKTVAGAVNLRPDWFFDTSEQGEALGDVATHLVDLAAWSLFPEQSIDHTRDVEVARARRWPTAITADQLLRLTGARALDAGLASRLVAGRLDYMANGEVAFALRGRWVRVRALWNFEAAAGGGDTHTSVLRGSLARLEIRQGADTRWRPELYVVPIDPSRAVALKTALESRLRGLSSRMPDLQVADEGARLRVVIPDRYHVGHEAHFAEVTRRFLEYVKSPRSLPAWERAAMLTKYFVTTRAVELSRRP